MGDRLLSSAGAGRSCALPMRLPDPSPVLEKILHPWVQEFFQCGCWEELCSPYEVARPQPSTGKNLARMGPGIPSSIWARVWRKFPGAFPDSSFVLARKAPVTNLLHEIAPRVSTRWQISLLLVNFCVKNVVKFRDKFETYIPWEI